jgi:6,7-dimethyl-8-ribityllumazine synthase
VKDVSLKYNKPVIFGVLTDDNDAQARARSGGEHGNKGVEAAITAIKMVALKRQLEDSWA